MAEYSVLRDLLREFGLEGIYNDVVGFITEDASQDEIYLALRENDEYRQRFRAVFEREEAGLPPISAMDVVNYERDLGQLFSFYGYPQEPGENIQDITANLMVNDVSDVEVEQRLAGLAAFGRQVLDDPENQGFGQQLLGLGATLYDVAEYALNPNETIEKVQRRLTAAAVANEAFERDYQLNQQEALELARQGVDAEEAEEQFARLRNQRQVVDRLVGDNADPIDRETELAAVAGDLEAVAAIERQGQRRAAASQVGGQFATDDEGFGGIR